MLKVDEIKQIISKIYKEKEAAEKVAKISSSDAKKYDFMMKRLSKAYLQEAFEYFCEICNIIEPGLSIEESEKNNEAARLILEVIEVII